MLHAQIDMNTLEIESEDEGIHDDNEDDALTETFNLPYTLGSEISVSVRRTYILHIDGNSTNENVAVALSDQSCTIYDVSQMKKLTSLQGHGGTISNIKFCPTDSHLVYSSSLDGTIKLWDTRLDNNIVKEFKDDSEGNDQLKPLTDFDVSHNNRFISAGTELINEDAFILFWDVRSTNLLGGYWESHMDDITQVKFHPEKQDILATGSTDGLINTFDISKSSEDDALLQSLNTESSVEKIHWFAHGDGDHSLSCITHTQDLQLWRLDGAAPYLRFDRESISKSMQRKSSEDCFMVNVHTTKKPEEILLLTGATAGRGECLRTLSLHKKKLKPTSNFVGNKQIVRASWYNKNSEILITGGESGIISLWRPKTGEENISIAEDLKMNAKQKAKHRKKPY
ncbi:WD repeat-containing protein 89 [Blattella germanica]|nr:WD repeat-containing protein 89 [Blattella germanica]